MTSALRFLRLWGPSRPSIFISYRRRGDSAGFAARLTDRLVGHFGAERCFRDIEDIESGMDFVDAIDDAVASCEVMIVVVGTDWVTVENAAGRRRLDDPHDFVRLEVATALRRGVRVVPVLVAGAPMPSADQLPDDLKPLARRQAHEMTDLRWEYDVGRLLTSLEGMGIRAKRNERAPGAWLFRGGLLGGRLRTAALSLVGLVGMGLLGVSILSPEYDQASYVPALEQAGVGGPVDGLTASPTAGDGTLQGGGSTRASAAPDVTSEPPAPAATEPPAPRRPARDPVEVHRDDLVASIRAANDASSYALATLDVGELPAFFEGDALDEQLETVGQMALNGVTVSLELLEQGFTGFQVDEAMGLATVDMVERWRIIYRNALTEMCVGLVPSVEMASRVHLRSSASGWMVHRVDGEDVPLEPRPC